MMFPLPVRFSEQSNLGDCLPLSSPVPRLFFPFLLEVAEKKDLVDLRRTFCATDSQILGVVNRC